jgi:hypothetical protein
MLFRVATIITPIITPVITPILRTTIRLHHRSPILYRPHIIVDPILSSLINSSRSPRSNRLGGIVKTIQLTWTGDVGNVEDVWDECTSSTDEPEEMPKETPQETPQETPTEYNPEWDIDHIRKNGGL